MYFAIEAMFVSSRFKVGRMEQSETSDQAKARGGNSVSVSSFFPFFLSLSFSN